MRTFKTRIASKKVMAIASLAAASMLMAGCGGGSTADSNSSGDAKDPAAAAAASARLEPLLEPVKTISVTEPLTSAPEPGKTAYLILFSSSTTADLVAPFEDSVEALGWTPKVITVDPADPLGAANGIKQAVQAGADYIVDVLGDIPTMKPGLDVAKAAGVPVVVYSGTGDADPSTNGVYGMINTAEGAVGTLVPPMDWAIADSGGAADVLFVTLPEAEIVRVSAAAATKHVEENCPRCTVHQLGVSFAQLGAGGLADLVVPEVRKNPDVKYVVVGVSPAANGLREALDAAGLNDVQIAVGNLTSDQLEMVRNGDVGIGTINGLGEVMWEATDMLARIDIDMKFNAEDYAGHPFATFTADNLVADVDTYLGAENYEEQYLKLWGKG